MAISPVNGYFMHGGSYREDFIPVSCNWVALVAHWLEPLHSLFLVRDKEQYLWWEPQAVEMIGVWHATSPSIVPLLGHCGNIRPIEQGKACSILTDSLVICIF